MPNTTAKKPPAKTRPKRAKTAAGPTSQTAPTEAKVDHVVDTTGYLIGALVSHPMFGDGTVTAIDADKLTIKFEDGRIKQIVDYYVKRRAP
jgi:cyanate lyase